MADIDSILAGIGGQTRADFSAIGDLPKAYWEGKDQKAKNDLRDVFKGGLPMKGDQVDWPTVTQKFFEVGANDQGMAAAGQALAQQKMENAQKLGERAFPTGSDGPPPAQAPIVSPPSASAPRLKEVAAPLNKGGVQAQGGRGPQGDQPGSIVGLLSAAGLSDEEQGPFINQLSAKFKKDPNATLDPATSQRVQEVVKAAVQRLRSGQQPQGAPQAQQPPQVAQAPMQPPQGQQAPVMAPPQTAQPDFNSRFSAARPGQGSDPTLGGLVPAGRTAQQQMAGLSKAINTGNLDPQQAKVYQSHIDALQKALERPNEQKLYDKAVEQGFKGTIQEWMDRTDDNTTSRDVLTKSTLPRLDESQKKAMAARDDVDTIHRSRIELDRPDGIFSGAFAGDKLKLAKAAEIFGLSNPDKIANTEAFSSAAGQRVASLIKAFGSGTAISDGDRKFTEAIAGGNRILDEKSIRRILDIGEKADRLIIERHNAFADKAVASNEGLKASRDTYIVEHPGQYKKPEKQNAATIATFSNARKAIDGGAPIEAVKKHLKDNGYNPADL